MKLCQRVGSCEEGAGAKSWCLWLSLCLGPMWPKTSQPNMELVWGRGVRAFALGLGLEELNMRVHAAPVSAPGALPFLCYEGI